jgi:2,3-dihydroxybenzoate decarboxylase
MKFSGKISLEEHIASPETVKDSEALHTHIWDGMRQRLLDRGTLLAEMDAAGVETSILSLNSPVIQAIRKKQLAIEAAQRGNDFLAEQVAKNPGRLQAFAALPMQDPEAAAQELVRCVNELGFKGAKVNGFSETDQNDGALYYDASQYWPFWATVESLDVPFYLHPRDPLPTRQQIYADHSWMLGSVWSFAVETATHSLRMMGSGLFDKYPKLTIVLGHLGETLPNAIWRVDHRINCTKQRLAAKKNLGEYLRNNFYFTTSGNFCSHALIDTILEVGADRILFSVDYPYESMIEAAEWFDNTTAISETDKLKIGRTNAEKLLKMGAKAKAAVS